MTPIGERITEARKKKNMSVGQVAIKARRSKATIVSLIYNAKRPRLDTLINIADALEVSIDYLAGRTDVMEMQKNGLD